MPPEDQREMTYGERAVGSRIDPSNSDDEQSCKNAFAIIIDNLARLRDEAADSEKKRVLSVAITEAQSAQMWAVKGITFPEQA